MVTGNYYYVDKSLFIKEIIDKGDKILLIPRPRRFGKTLNISMLKYFYDCCPQALSSGSTKDADFDSTDSRTGPAGNFYGKLFDSLAISKAGKKYLDHMGKYPVIFLTFKNIKELDWETQDYQVKSNRESGYGRYDIMIIPGDPAKLGYIIEFKKVRRKETVESAVESALKQIDERKYETELLERGIKTYKKLAVIFNGKDVTIRES